MALRQIWLHPSPPQSSQAGQSASGSHRPPSGQSRGYFLFTAPRMCCLEIVWMIVSPRLSQSFRIIVVRFIRIEGMAQAEQARDHERRRSVADYASERVLDVLAILEFFTLPGEEFL